MFKKSAWVVGNEDREFHSGTGAAHGGTEHSVLEYGAEAQHEEDGGSGTAEEDGDDSCPVAGGAGESGTPLNLTITKTKKTPKARTAGRTLVMAAQKRQ
jgi:hypothetical protein